MYFLRQFHTLSKFSSLFIVSKLFYFFCHHRFHIFMITCTIFFSSNFISSVLYGVFMSRTCILTWWFKLLLFISLHFSSFTMVISTVLAFYCLSMVLCLIFSCLLSFPIFILLLFIWLVCVYLMCIVLNSGMCFYTWRLKVVI